MKGATKKIGIISLKKNLWTLPWLIITPCLVMADPGFPGSISRTKMAFPMEGQGFLLEPAGFVCGFGSLGESSFQSLDSRIGLELGFLPWISFLAGIPLYLDHCSGWTFGRGDFLCGAGLRWRPWADRSVWLAVFPFMTVPTGQDGLSVDSLRRFSTDGLDYGVLGALSLVPWEKSILGINIGAYNPNQAKGYGSHTNQVIYRALWIRQMAAWAWLGAELSGEWFLVNRIAPEVSFVSGGSPLRLSAVSLISVGPVHIGVSPGLWLTDRHLEQGDSLVYPSPIYTLPVGDVRWEIAGSVSIGNSGLLRGRAKASPGSGGVIAGKAIYPDGSPATISVEVLETGARTHSDTTGAFVLSALLPDSYTVCVSGQAVASVDPMKVVVMEGETTMLNLTVEKVNASNATVILRDMITRKEIDGMVMAEGISNNGITAPKTFSVAHRVTFPLMPGAYVITGKADGYFAQSMPLTMADRHDVQVVIDLIPQGFTLEFPGVLFEFGSAIIKKDAYPVLDSIAGVVRTVFAANPNLKIEVGGYTDNVGTDKANMRLSEERAKAVANFLMDNYGLNPDRVIYKGYGPAHPRAPNTTEEGRSQNRRVEIRFLEVI